MKMNWKYIFWGLGPLDISMESTTYSFILCNVYESGMYGTLDLYLSRLD